LRFLHLKTSLNQFLIFPNQKFGNEFAVPGFLYLPLESAESTSAEFPQMYNTLQEGVVLLSFCRFLDSFAPIIEKIRAKYDPEGLFFGYQGGLPIEET
jgi:hypothetical protein